MGWKIWADNYMAQYLKNNGEEFELFHFGPLIIYDLGTSPESLILNKLIIYTSFFKKQISFSSEFETQIAPYAQYKYPIPSTLKQ